MSLDSPRDSGNRTPDYDKTQDGDKIYGRKIDAYSSEEEDLNGPDSTIVEVEKDAVPMTIKVKKGKSDSSGEKSRKDQNKDVKHNQMKTSKSAPKNSPGGGKKRTKESRKKSIESSESEELTPRRQQVLTPQSTDHTSRTPSPQNQPGSPQYKHLEGSIQSKDSPKKDSKPSSPKTEQSLRISPDPKPSPMTSPHTKPSPVTSPDPKPSPSPGTSPEFLHTVWDEESEVTQSPDEDWNQKKQSISQDILKEFGKKEEDVTYMADDEDTERTDQTLDRGASQDTNERVASAIIGAYGKDQEQSDAAKNKQVASAIIGTYGKEQEQSGASKNERVASAIIDTYGRDEDQMIDNYGKDKEENISEQILKQFGGEIGSEKDSSEKMNDDDSQQLDKEKQSRISEEMQKHFGKQPVNPNFEEDQQNSERISEEILKQFGGNDKNERVAEEIVKLYGQKEEGLSQKPEESTNGSREWRTEAEIKQNAVTENEQPSLKLNDKKSDLSSEKKMLKRESQDFFQPAIDIRNQQAEASKSKSDSSKSEEEKTVQSSELSTSTQSSAITPDTTTAPTTTQESSIDLGSFSVAKAESSTTKPTTTDSDDSSSDSDSDSTSESDSDSSSTTSSSSSDSDTNTGARTPRPQDNEVKMEQKLQANEPDNKSNENVPNKESESNEDETNESKKPNAKPGKSVTFRNTPEPFTYHVSDTESENMQYGGNDPDQVGNGEPGQRPSTSLNSSVKLHGGSIKHLLQDENDIHLDSISLDKHQMEEICDDIKSKSEVKTLSLRHCNLKDEDMENLSEALITSPSEPVMLNLNLNNLSSTGMDCIVDIMKNEPTLDILLLQGNYIGDEGVRILCQGIISIHHEARQKRKQSLLRQNSQLQLEDSVQVHTDQAGNRIPPPINLKRRSSLFDPAREARFCRLGELDIGDVGLTDKGIEFISLLLEANVYLETLSLSSNPGVSKNGWLRLGQALEKNRRLQNLTLDFNNLGDDAMTFLCRGLKDNRTLTALDLEETNIGERGGRMLLELLKRNTTLLDITLTPGNDIPDSTVSEIRRFLALNKAASY